MLLEQAQWAVPRDELSEKEDQRIAKNNRQCCQSKEPP